MNIAFPFSIARNGNVSDSGREQHVRQLIEQVLFTMPGQRVNLPEFGSGLQKALFAPVEGHTLEAVRFSAQAALHQWLGHLIEPVSLVMEAQGSQLDITLSYHFRGENQIQEARFRKALST